jgi:parallel beta-helix repeat protein
MKPSLLVCAVSLLCWGATSSSATDVFVVDEDGVDCPNADFTTIQGAVDAAAPGDKILVCAGTYHERVLITKSELTLQAKGAPGDVTVDADLIGNGILISGASGVTIEGFTVREGHDNDISLLAADGNTLRKNVLTAAVHDPINLVNSDDNLIEHNVSIDNLAANACGINLAVGSDGNTVRHNLLVNNEWGIQIAGSADNVIFHNEARGNRGNGIRNVGNSSGTVIENNRAFGNGFAPNPATTGTTNAGIRIGSGTGVVVVRNHAFDNSAVDLRSDVAAATFDNNHCNTSSPPGLCAHDEGKGH